MKFRFYLKLACLIVASLILTWRSVTVYGLTAAERRTYTIEGIHFIDDPCPVVIDGIAANTTEAEANVIRTIIGIAKNFGLDKKGALIGLMVSITEAHYKIYANTGNTYSRQNPLWLALPEPRPLGNDYDSVGIMQQRVTTGWSTYGNYTGGGDPEKDKNVTWQLMDPAYAAQAFFGTPPGGILPQGLAQPSALTKGLQNVHGWESMDPWIAAQSVQRSAFADGSNYRKNMAQAQADLDANWDASPPVPLPIPVQGGANSTQAVLRGDTCLSFGTGSEGALVSTIMKYAWPTYHPAPDTTPTAEYATAIRKARCIGEFSGSGCKPEYVGGGEFPGIDCGGYVTRLMRDSGIDPEYNGYQGYTVLQQKWMDDHPDKYQKIDAAKVRSQGTAALTLGDIAISAGHTYMYVGSIPGFSGSSTSASIGPGSWRSPMADDTYLNGFDWYHPLMIKRGN